MIFRPKITKDNLGKAKQIKKTQKILKIIHLILAPFGVSWLSQVTIFLGLAAVRVLF